MSSPEGPVYTGWRGKPWPPDAPRGGDLVVIVQRQEGYSDTLDGQLARVTMVDPRHVANLAWLVTWVHSVRRPTEAELAAWVLGGGHG